MSQGSSVPRDTVFVLRDGSFVVQREENRIQEIISGQYRHYQYEDYGSEISDFELSQLKAAGRVDHYSADTVWLRDLPMNAQAATVRNYASAGRKRAYYLNTTLPAAHMDHVRQEINKLNLEDRVATGLRSDMVAVLGRGGFPFYDLQDAEWTQKALKTKSPELFAQTAIAFFETNEQEDLPLPPAYARSSDLPAAVVPDIDEVREVTVGKRVLILMSSADERMAIADYLLKLGMVVTKADTGVAGLHLLEDIHPDLLVMSMQLPDMHGWELLAKIKEIGTFASLPKIMIADYRSKSDDQVFALTVGKVDVYLVKPLSMTRLRQNIWLTLHNDID